MSAVPIHGNEWSEIWAENWPRPLLHGVNNHDSEGETNYGGSSLILHDQRRAHISTLEHLAFESTAQLPKYVCNNRRGKGIRLPAYRPE